MTHIPCRPIARKAALALVPLIIDRAHQVNNNALMKHRIGRVALFGSVMTDKKILGDLDVGVEVIERDRPFCMDAFLARYPIPSHAPGLDRLFWPAVVAKCTLRVHSSVQTSFWPVVMKSGGPYKMIFDGRLASDG